MVVYLSVQVASAVSALADVGVGAHNDIGEVVFIVQVGGTCLSGFDEFIC